jgi:hypothetical protein
MFSSAMPEHGQSLAFLITLGIFALVMVLVLRRKITERFAILWLAISFLLLFASSIGFRYLFKIAQAFGIPYPPSALFLIAIFGLTLLVIELFAWVSKLNDRSRIVAQQIALLCDALDREIAKHGGEMPVRDAASFGNSRLEAQSTDSHPVAAHSEPSDSTGPSDVSDSVMASKKSEDSATTLFRRHGVVDLSSAKHTRRVRAFSFRARRLPI